MSHSATTIPQPTDLKKYINDVIEGHELSRSDAENALDQIMTGNATAAQVAALLTALRMRGETTGEIAGFAATMRRHSLAVDLGDDPRPVVDVVGTGGDGKGTFNVSTTAAFVVAGAGVRVAKHGNRSVTSMCGSADVLEAAGVRLDLSPEQVGRCVNEAGIGFMFAQAFHPAMRYVAPVRREIGVRTIFNVLGPVTNPAGVKHHLVGVPNRIMGRRLADVLAMLGSEHALIVSSEEGVDEIGVSGETYVFDLGPNWKVDEYVISPEQFCLKSAPITEILGGDAAHNAVMMTAVLDGVQGPTRTAAVLNAGAAIYAANAAASIDEGIALAQQSIDSGRARKALDDLVALSQAMMEQAGA